MNIWTRVTVFVLVAVYSARASNSMDESDSGSDASHGKSNSAHETNTETGEEYESNSSDEAVSSAESVVHNIDAFLVDVHKAVYLLRELGIHATMGSAMTHMLNSYVDLVQLSLRHLVVIGRQEAATDEALALVISEIQRITASGYRSTSDGSVEGSAGISSSTKSHSDHSTVDVPSQRSRNAMSTATTTTTTDDEILDAGKDIATTSAGHSSGNANAATIESNHAALSSIIAGAVSNGMQKSKGLKLKINVHETSHDVSEATHHVASSDSTGYSGSSYSGSSYSSQPSYSGYSSSYSQPAYSATPSYYYAQPPASAVSTGYGNQGYDTSSSGYASGASSTYSNAPTTSSSSSKKTSVSVSLH